MQVFAFAMVMLLLFVFGISCITVAVILLCIDCKVKKKLLKVSAILVAVIGMTTAIIPVGWIAMLRSANGEVDQEAVDTGETIFWQEDTFVYQDTRYAAVGLTTGTWSTDSAFFHEVLSFVELDQQDVVVNIERKGLLNTLLNAHDRIALYKVESAATEHLLYGYELYCPQDEVDAVRAYYIGHINDSWYLSRSQADEESQRYALSVSEEERAMLDGLQPDSATELISPDEIDDALVLNKSSADGVVSAYLYLMKVGSNWYFDSEQEPEDADSDATYACPLPDSLSDQIEQVLKTA